MFPLLSSKITGIGICKHVTWIHYLVDRVKTSKAGIGNSSYFMWVLVCSVTKLYSCFPLHSGFISLKLYFLLNIFRQEQMDKSHYFIEKGISFSHCVERMFLSIYFYKVFEQITQTYNNFRACILGPLVRYQSGAV